MKATKTLLSVVLAFLFLFGGVFSAFADESDTPITDDIGEKYTNIQTISSNFSISVLTASCNARMVAKSSMSLKIKMELQKKSSGVYSTISTWNASKTGTTLSLSKTKTINPLSTYRLKVTFTAGSESTTVYKYP